MMKKFSYSYLNKFKQLEVQLKKVADVSSDVTQFKDILDRAKQNNPLIRYQEGLIWDLYGLRNVFAHADREKYIATVSKLAYDAIDNLINLIQNPPTVGDKFQKKVYWTIDEEIMKNVIQTMRQNLYTHIPVYKRIKGGYKFKGVFSESAMFYWLADNIKNIQLNFANQPIQNINLKYLNDPNDLYKFVAPDKSIFSVYEEFKSAISKRKRLGAIFITSSGNKDALPIGIITAWDLPEIESYFRNKIS